MGKETAQEVTDGRKAKGQQENDQYHPQVGFNDPLFND
jgi:hypothetical protein